MSSKLIALLLLLIAAPAYGANYWVDGTNGSDANGCTASATPLTTTAKATLNAGIACLSSGDTLSVRTGTYGTVTAANIPAGTSWTSPTTFKAHTAETVTITAQLAITGASQEYIVIDGFIIDRSGGSAGVFIWQADHIRLVGNEIRNSSESGLQLFNPTSDNEVIRNKIHDHGTSGFLDHCIYTSGGNSLFEYNEIYNCTAYGIQNYGDATSANSIFRYNEIYNFANLTDSSAGGIVLCSGADNRAYNNLIYDGGQVGAGVGAGISTCSTSTQYFYNNTIYNVSGYGIDLQGGGAAVVRNNVFYTTDLGSMNDPLSVGTFSHNLCTTTCSKGTNNVAGDPLVVDAAADNYALTATSPAIDAGTTAIATGITVTGNGAAVATIGAHDPPRFSSCSATGNTLSVVFTNNVFPPISFATVTGSTGIIDSTSRTLSAPTVVGSNQVDLTFSGAAVSAAATYAYATTGTVRDSADIGRGNGAAGTGNHQRLNAVSTQTCSVAASSGTFEQKVFRFHGLRGTEAAPSVLPHSASSNSTNIKVVKGGAYRIRIAILRNTADTVAIAPTLYYSKNSAAYAAVPANFGADNLRFFGTAVDPDIPTHGTATTNLLGAVGAGSFVAGALIRTDASIPNASLAPTNWTEFEWTIEHDTDSTVNDTFDFRVRDQAGAVLDTYTVTPRATVIDYTAGSGA